MTSLSASSLPAGTWRTRIAYGSICLTAVAIVVLAPLPYVGRFGVEEHLAFDRACLLVPFLSWVPNLLVAERFLSRPRQRELLARLATCVDPRRSEQSGPVRSVGLAKTRQFL